MTNLPKGVKLFELHRAYDKHRFRKYASCEQGPMMRCRCGLLVWGLTGYAVNSCWTYSRNVKLSTPRMQSALRAYRQLIDVKWKEVFGRQYRVGA